VSDATRSDSIHDPARERFRATLVRVLIVQLVSVIVLGSIQIFYNR
jgi:hypothetical protein